MWIIEKSVIGKMSDDTLCEDTLFINEHFIAVIDGATSKGKLLWEGRKAGWYASKVLAAALAEFQPEIKAEEAIILLNQSLANASKPVYEQLTRDHFERLAASIVVYSVARRQVWSFGDCQYAVNGRHYQEEKKIDTLLAKVRSFVLQAELANGRTLAELRDGDPGREAILPFLELQSQFANRGDDWRYAVLDGFEIDLRDLKIVDVPAGSEVILASDGYPELKATLAESEAALAEVFNEDPLCMSRFKSTKGFVAGQRSFDDRAYIRIET